MSCHCVAGHVQWLRLQQTLFHLCGLHHRAGERHWQPSAVVPALSQGHTGGGQVVCEHWLPRSSQPHGERGRAQFQCVWSPLNPYHELILLTVIFCLAVQDGPLVLEPGPVFAKDGDKNRSEQISYKILRGLNKITTCQMQLKLKCVIFVFFITNTTVSFSAMLLLMLKTNWSSCAPYSWHCLNECCSDQNFIQTP